jgi:hypothetical protein
MKLRGYSAVNFIECMSLHTGECDLETGSKQNETGI